MKVAVSYSNQSFEIDIVDSCLVGHWQGKPGLQGDDATPLIREGLESAIDYPALRRCVVPGDRVVIALGLKLPETNGLIRSILGILDEAGVTSDTVSILGASDVDEKTAAELSAILPFRRHDPANREGLAYLASTAAERRIYLDRDLVDADMAITVGRLGFDPRFGYVGPWSALLPGFSDEETRSTFGLEFLKVAPSRDEPPAPLTESWEANRLLGSQFQIGVLPGVVGVLRVLTGSGTLFNDRCVEAIEESLGVHPESRAELVVAGVDSNDINGVAKGLSAASRLVRRGGKIVLLSEAEGRFGRSFRRLVEAERSGRTTPPLRGLEAEPDFIAASQFAEAVAWADVYLLSKLDARVLDELGIVTLDKPREAQRLAAVAESCFVLSSADQVGAEVSEESE